MKIQLKILCSMIALSFISSCCVVGSPYRKIDVVWVDPTNDNVTVSEDVCNKKVSKDMEQKALEICQIMSPKTEVEISTTCQAKNENSEIRNCDPVRHLLAKECRIFTNIKNLISTRNTFLALLSVMLIILISA